VQYSKSHRATSALGQKQTSDRRPLMSALPPKADIAERDRNVRFVPIADVAKLLELLRKRNEFPFDAKFLSL
jgi:hypothetical protein